MSTRIRPRKDRTLGAKRAIYGTFYRIARLPLLERIAALRTAPEEARLALALGERLVRTPRRILALTAHPDDLEFFAGGTLRRMALAGSEIHAVVLSDGEKRGNWTDLGNQRRSEQEHAARILGYASTTYLGLADFGLPEDPRVEHLVNRAWETIAPEVVLAFDPKELLPNMANRDHKALGRTVMDLARKRLQYGAEIYFYGTQHPDVLVEITAVMPAKLEAVKAHQSQMVYLDEEETNGAIRLMGRIGAGNSGALYAEGLYRLI